MAVATLPSVDWDIISNMGISAAKSERDALALTSGFMDSQEDSHGAGKPAWTGDVGPAWQVKLNVYNHSGITAFPSGYEGFDPTARGPTVSAFYQPAVCGILMKIGQTEMYILGQTPGALNKLVKDRIVSCMGFLHRQWSRQMVAGGGSGFTQWGTLNGIDYTGASGGVLERSAVGSQSNTIGGLSKSTYSFAIGWQNVIVDMADAFATNYFKMDQALNRIGRHTNKNGMKMVWLVSEQCQTNINHSERGKVMYVNKKELDAGQTVPTYRGNKIYMEPQMPISAATGGSATTTYPLSAIALNTKDIFPAWLQAPKGPDGIMLPPGYFGVGRWEKVSGQSGVFACPIMCAGQLITEDMGGTAAVIRGETY